MRRATALAGIGVLGALGALAFDGTRADAAPRPQVFAVVLGRDTQANDPTWIVIGVGLAKAKSFELRFPGGGHAATPAVLTRSATMIALRPPPGFTEGAYQLVLDFGRGGAQQFDVATSAGPIVPGTLTKDDFTAAARQDLDDAATLGGYRASDFAQASGVLTTFGGNVGGFLNVVGNPTTAIQATSNAPGTPAIWAFSTPSSGAGAGLIGTCQSGGGSGVVGVNSMLAGAGTGVYGQTFGLSGIGVYGEAKTLNGASVGVQGLSPSPAGTGVFGLASSTTGTTVGVSGRVVSPDGVGVFGAMTSATGTGSGVTGSTQSVSGTGVYGVAANASGAGTGAYGISAAASGIGVVGRATNGGIGVEAVADAGGRALYALQAGGGSGTAAIVANHAGASGDVALVQSAGGNVARIDKNGVGFFNGGAQTGGADFAESVSVNRPKSEFEPGDVIVIDATGRRRFALSTAAESPLVAGVYATKPGVLARPGDVADGGAWRDVEVPMAITGIVPCKVCDEGGAVKAGDLLVSASIAGHAKKAPASPAPGTIVGKALEPLAGARGKIEVLITLR